MNQDARGFTIVELVTVVVILGILVAVALVPYINFATEAEAASVRGSGLSMATAVNLARTKRDISDTPNATAMSFDEFDNIPLWFYSGTNSWPFGAGNVFSANPTISGCALLGATLVQGAVIDANANASSNGTGEYFVSVSATTDCVFSYFKNTAFGFTYETDTGSIIIDDTP